MRSISFAIIGATKEQVAEHLRDTGYDGPHEGYQWYFPSASESVLRIDVGGYEWVEKYDLQEEYDELVAAIEGKMPAVHVSVDVSGNAPGDDEVRRIARDLLSKFDGYVFDDYLSYEHAWTLEEIESDVKVDGLTFFDYRGAAKR